MLLITGTFRVPPANLEAARPVMAAMVDGSRAEAGCAHYSYGEDLLDPGLIHVTEQWSDRAALDAHWASPHMRGLARTRHQRARPDFVRDGRRGALLGFHHGQG